MQKTKKTHFVLLGRAELRPMPLYESKFQFKINQSFLTISGAEEGNECPQEVIRYLSIDGMEADTRYSSVKDTVQRDVCPCGMVIPQVCAIT